MLHDYDEYMFLFFDFVNIFDCYDYVVVFEDKTKAGLPTKPHFHGVLKIDYSKKVESIRDKVKKYFNDTGHTGTHSQVKIIEDIDEYTKAILYTLKWQDVELTDLDDIDEYLKQSEQYNKQLRDNKLNTWREHESFMYEVIKHNHEQKPLERSRYSMLRHIHNYIYDWNKRYPDNIIKRPVNQTIMSFIYNTEIKLFSKEDSLERFLEDFSFNTTCHPTFYDQRAEKYDPLEEPINNVDSIEYKNFMVDNKEHQLYEFYDSDRDPDQDNYDVDFVDI